MCRFLINCAKWRFNKQKHTNIFRMSNKLQVNLDQHLGIKPYNGEQWTNSYRTCASLQNSPLVRSSISLRYYPYPRQPLGQGLCYFRPTGKEVVLWSFYRVYSNKLSKLEDALAPLVATLCHNLKVWLTHSLTEWLTNWLTDGVTTRDAIASKKSFVSRSLRAILPLTRGTTRTTTTRRTRWIQAKWTF